MNQSWSTRHKITIHTSYSNPFNKTDSVMKDDNIRQAIDSTMQSTQTYTLVIRRQPVKFNSVMLEQFWTRRLQSMHTHAVRHVSFMRHLKKICGPHKHQIYGGNMVQNCFKPTSPSCSTGVQTHGWCHSVVNQMVEVTKLTRKR